MIYVVGKNRKTKDTKVVECQSAAQAKAVIEDNWDEYSPIAIFVGTRVNFTISYADEEEIIIKRKPKVSIA